MESEFFTSTLISLGINLLYTLVSLTFAVVFLLLVDRFLLRSIHLQDEIRKGNIAASIFASSLMIFVGIIIGLGLK